MNQYSFVTNRKRKSASRHNQKKNKKHNDGDESSEDEEDNPFAALFKSEDKVFSNQNHIYFRCEVNMENTNKLVNLIRECNDNYLKLKVNCKIASMEPLPIYIHITTFGGSLFCGFMIYDAIKRSHISIYTVAEGHAISAGSIILMGGIKKYATPNTYILVHQLRSTESGTFEQLVDENCNNIMLMANMKTLYLDNTQMKSKDIDSLLKRDLFLDVQKCLNFGIIDEIYTEDK